ncbi:UxaA family hydrolase [Mesosutterella sp. OilRF-GAM-744-9]|uniref:UxaA family hydrolase n=1 Tax=Mesosutterella porci TaxID=2915351 RepID=A0ABS9MQL7_9BURK|nr:UxaA family hydrolase [Mesosutterella sp. oilRF-744-WT-GAM-9]MCG5030827.1 UxaA family hydrolase [Mesosutterella sp. oilRF-744-WT-GAM-9]MCI6530730.1 UxaA family hydrolase [Mesosutterella sp.]
MSEKTFLGYMRPDGHAGARNCVLIMPVVRSLNFIASNVARMTRMTRHFEIPAETGRPEKDRETIARTMIGLMHNPNVGGVLLLAIKPAASSAYKNMGIERFIAEAEKTGRPWRVVYLTESGGSYGLLGEALRAARELIVTVSGARRTPCPLSSLTLAVKCGTSDATSGIAGNPCVGAAFDRVVNAGGTAFFSETTEIIGAENLVAARAATPEVSRKILAAAKRWEDKALSTGEDIREINPIPANIAAGISTLEEKSLGAIAKSGHARIEDVLQYAQRPAGHGLYFIDAWMSSLSLPLCFAASGAAIVLYQMGGGAMPNHPMMPAINPTVVSPFLYVTGNKNAYARSPDNFDFNSSPIMAGEISIADEGEKLLDHLLEIGSGTLTRMETLNYAEQLEVFMEGPVL